MTLTITPGPRTPVWAELQTQATRLAAVPVHELFERDPRRLERFTREAAGLLLDFSRQRLDEIALARLAELADATGLKERIAAMWRGEHINTTEDRAVLHVALRQPPGAAVGGAQTEQEVMSERARMLAFAESVRGGTITGSSGQPFRLVVNIGIGGSDLGPAMAVLALRAYTGGAPRCEFVSNIDGVYLAQVLEAADPATTLFIVASKTFTTLETLTNARSARAWLAQRLGEAAVPRHFAAVSVNHQAMDAFGVHPQYRFKMWDWVGGRYSVWSSIGVSLAIAIGERHFRDFLAGGHEMDEHFRSAPWQENLPVLMGLTAVWNINFMKLPTLAVLPYDDSLRRFPAYLQQLEMESNGKSVMLDRRAGRVRDRSGDLGRGGQQRPAFLLPAAAPGQRARRARLPAAGALLVRQPAAAGPGDRQLPRTGRGAQRRGVRRDRARRAHARRDDGGADRGPGAPQGESRQPAEHAGALPAARSGDARSPHRALRALRAHAERRVGHRCL